MCYNLLMNSASYTSASAPRRSRTRKIKLPLIFLVTAVTVCLVLFFIARPNTAPTDESGDSTTTPAPAPKTLVYVTDFYDPTQDISSADVDKYQQIDIEDLTPDQKLLSVDGAYPLDDYKTDEIFTINQTGTTAIARRLLYKMREVGDGAFFAANIKDFLSKTDLTHISNEVSFASDCESGLTMTFCTDYSAFDTIAAIGTDVVELTGNHNNDWGANANLATIDFYHEKDLKTFGGGKNEEEAAIPLEFSEKGTALTWIAINNSTSSKENGQGASADHPGANIYDEATTRAQITEAKQKGNYVLVDVQYSECYCYPDYDTEYPACDAPITGQAEFFRSLIDMGADMVVGTSAHQPQTYELYNGKPIYYGLGNLFFDQTMWPDTTKGYILTHYFRNGKLIQTRLSPTVYDTSYQTGLMDTTAATSFLTRLLQSSPRGV